MNTDWLIPDWPAAPNVRAVFTSRSGGVSARPWDSLNLGDHVGDDTKNVASNRALLQQATGTQAVFLKQVHGFEVLNLAADTPDGFEADACVTSKANLSCTIMVADCLPVLLSNTAGSVVAAAHAGWRGLAGSANLASGSVSGILEAVYESFKAVAQAQRAKAAINSEANPDASDVMAWLGPCIGPTAFEVGAEVKVAFEAAQPEAAACFKPTNSGKYLADLPALARLRLAALGVTDVYGNDSSPAWCTVSQPLRFFSHRRDAGPNGNGFGTTGRMAACIWLDKV